MAFGSSISLLTTSLGMPTGMVGWQVLQSKAPSSFGQFMADPVLKQQIAYFKANIGKATTAADLLKDPILSNVALTAYGLSGQIGANAFMTKVLNSNTADTSSLANKLATSSYKTMAAAFGYGSPAVAAQPAVASSADVTLSGLDGTNSFGTFSGTFGGVTLSNVDVSGDTSPNAIANTLTRAFQKADGNRADISVSVDDKGQLVFNDAKGRGTAVSFAWTGSKTGPAAAAPSDTVAGSTAVLASGGTAQAAQAATASTAEIDLSNMTGSNNFTTFNGAFGDISLYDVDLSKAKTPADVAGTLQAAFQKADGGAKNITVTANSDGSLIFNDAAGRGTASNMQFVTAEDDPNPPVATYGLSEVAGSQAHAGPGNKSWIPAVASQATVEVDGTIGLGSTLGSFSGTFGGVTISNVDLSHSYTMAQVATKLTAFYQAADGGSKNITVTVKNGQLLFNDAAGRGTAQSDFNFTTNPNDVLGQPTASIAPALTAGSPAVAASGGANINSASFVQTVIDKYTAAMFNQVVGNDDSNLSNALYAKQNISSVTNWYSVIADKKLATVVETALGLPDSFQKLDVDIQARMLKSRMDIKDLQDPTKVSKLLNKYVALSEVLNPPAGSSSTSPALAILSGITSGISSDSMSALLTST